MSLVVAIVLMTLLGSLSAAAALVILNQDGPGWRRWPSSRGGRGALAMLAAGCVLVAGAQYATARLLPHALGQPGIQPALDPAIIAMLAALAAGATLLVVGGRLVRPQGRPTVAHGFALVIALVAAIMVVAGPRPFQGVARSAPDMVSDEKIVERFHTLFYDSPQTWRTATWAGVVTWQNPNDVWMHQEIISEVKPDVIVETGTAAGGSALLWATLLEHVNPGGQVITIDIKDPLQSIRHIAARSPDGDTLIKRVEEAHRLPIWKRRVRFLKGSSTDPAIVAEVARRVKGRKTLVILDSLHTRDHVLAELRAYAPLVDVGSYVIVQDTNVNGHPVARRHGPGPMEAVLEFLAGTDEFEVDRSRERFLFTMHPNGYLRRVRSAPGAPAGG